MNELSSVHAAPSDPEQAARYILQHAQRQKPRAWRQGKRLPVLAHGPGEALAEIARVHVYQLPEPAARALCAWSISPHTARLFTRPLSTREVLLLQAEGTRCVSLLQAEDAARYGGELPFVAHDLCHLGKFTEPAHHTAQTGFFSQVARATQHPAWEKIDQTLGAEWVKDRDHVLADMNGAAVFLWVALRAKLSLWSRRAGLDLDEQQRALVEAMQFPEELRAAARAPLPSEREAALSLDAFFHSQGSRILSRCEG